MNTKFLKAGLVAAMVVMVTGCASTEGLVKSNVDNSYRLAKNDSGVVYGLVNVIASENETAKACAAINNADERCNTTGKYKAVRMASAFGFAASMAGTIAMVPTETTLKACATGGGQGCSYAKIKTERGKFSTLINVVTEGENGCHWSGMPKAGGVVCDDWDYHKDMRDWDTTNGVLTVKD